MVQENFSSFTLKHILEESEEEVRQYFEKYKIGEEIKTIEGLKSKGDILKFTALHPLILLGMTDYLLQSRNR